MGVVKTPRYAAAVVAFCSFLAACGGGGGPNPQVNTTPTSPTPTPVATPTGGTTTTASGTVVDDGTGAPIAGASVKLMPWVAGATPLPSPQATTAANGTFTLANVPNGHYLLVIGADAVATVPPGYTTPPGNCGGPCPTPSPVPGTPMQATVHDNVTLTGGNQTLKAPTLPSVPSGYTAPTWETNGDYRRATLNATTEMPCLIAWQYERAQNNLAGSSVDEWLIENVRALNAYQAVAPAGTGLGSMQVAGATGTSGGVACAGYIDPQFNSGFDAYATNPQTLWFAGQYIYSTSVGLAEFPVDPRAYTDPNHPTWP